MSEYYKRIEKKNECIPAHRYDVFGAHIVSVASSPSQRLVQAMWLCRGLGQSWRLLAVKLRCQENQVKIKEVEESK